MTQSDPALKMKRRPDARAAIIGAPTGYEACSFPGLQRAATSLTGRFDWIQIFVPDKARLDQLAPKAARALRPDSIL